MTLGTTVPQFDYVENGATLAHAIPFQFQASSEIACTRIPAGGVESAPLVLGVDYSVTGGAGLTGTVTKTNGGVAGTVFRIKRNTSRAQSQDYTAHGDFPAENTELALDRLAAVDEEQDRDLSDLKGRALQVPSGESAAPLPAAAARLGTVLGFNVLNGLRELLSYTALATVLVAPLVSLLGPAFKGDPGGNADAIGLFTAIGGMSIPAGFDRVKTSGYSTVGKGAAEYVYDVAVDAAYVIANPRTSFRTTNGRGYRLSTDQVFRPTMVGTASDGVTDDIVPLQAASDFFHANNPPNNFDGTYAISSQLTFGPAAAPSPIPAREIIGYMRLIALAPMNELIHVRNLPWRTWLGGVQPEGTGSVAFATRTCLIGVHYENCARLNVTAGTLAKYFALAGVWCGTPNNNMLQTGPITANDCGSGHAAGSLTGNWSLPVNSGADGSTSQALQLTVTSVPSAAILSYFVVGSHNIRIRLNGIPGAKYYVNSIDTVGMTVSVFPKIDPALGANGTFEWCFGGAGTAKGADSGLIDVERVDAFNCGRGWADGQLYPARIRNLQCNGCGTDIEIGANPSGGSLGLVEIARYTESTNSYEQIDVLPRFGGSNFHVLIGDAGATNIDRVFATGDPRGATAIVGGELGLQQQGGVTVGYKGRLLHPHKNNLARGIGSLINLSGHRRDPVPETYLKDSLTCQLTVQGVGAFNRLFGFSGGVIGFIGTGANGAPTGAFVFAPPAGGTINGGAVDATVTFSGFSGPVDFAYELASSADAAPQLNWKVFPKSGYVKKTTAAWDPPSCGPGLSVSTAIAVTGAAFGDAFTPSFDVSIGALLATANVSAAGQVTVKLFNPTAAAIDLAALNASVTRVS